MDAINEPAGLALIAGDSHAPHNVVPVHHHRATSHLILTPEGPMSRPLKEQESGREGRGRDEEREGEGRRDRGEGGERVRKER